MLRFAAAATVLIGAANAAVPADKVEKVHVTPSARSRAAAAAGRCMPLNAAAVLAAARLAADC